MYSINYHMEKYVYDTLLIFKFINNLRITSIAVFVSGKRDKDNNFKLKIGKHIYYIINDKEKR